MDRAAGVSVAESEGYLKVDQIGERASELKNLSDLVPPNLASELVPEALAWASTHGLVMGDKSIENSGKVPGVGLVHAPFCLFPTPFPAEAFEHAIDLAPLFNKLVDEVSKDGNFLQETLERTRKVDPFTNRLLGIHSRVSEEGIKQEVQLGMHRSDYMLDKATDTLFQVELNTISSSFAGLGSQVSNLHGYMIRHVERSTNMDAKQVPENTAADAFAEALALAWQEYKNQSAVVLMVVEPGERNMYDQYWLAIKLYESYGIRTIRKTLSEIYAQAHLSKDGALYIQEELVAVVYYRTGYSPTDYPTDFEWEARLLVEQSSAIKCPSISYHLAGTKKIQQELARPGVLERFLQGKESIEKVRSCFAGLWGLEGEGSTEIINKAIENPDAFVLKPQREGGGNNLYGHDIRDRLLELREKDGGIGLAAYILMQRLFPVPHTSYLVRGGVWSFEETASELGIFGAYLRNAETEILNKAGGYLLRTKVSKSNESGVAAGYGVLDSVYLL
ncbi:hypothetical protein O6H91_08G116300 [Diphasiastrum complanatum]|nr:hypothetical protein O6H91_08G116300 [Diphasiastrum complanatum]